MMTRLRRTGAVLATGSALALGLTACGGDDAAGSVAEAVAQGAATVGLDDCREEAPVDPEAAGVFGADEVRDAYCAAVAFTLDTSFVPGLAHRDAGSRHEPGEFAFAAEHMTPGAAAEWSELVDAALATDSEDDDDDVKIITLFDVYFDSGVADGWVTTPAGGPAAVDVVVTPGHTAVQPGTVAGTLLEVSLTLTANLLVAEADDTVVYAPTAKEITYWMAPGAEPSDPWLVSGWQGEFSTGETSATHPTAPVTVDAPATAAS
ncbi:hypothetical protein [Kineococcus arenarius]|uniref:hypothetical protein n=1 Tax=Kineococcus sp. SYSU DK007 TaxID=3383128 RepID=UPI003D7DF444